MNVILKKRPSYALHILHSIKIGRHFHLKKEARTETELHVKGK